MNCEDRNYYADSRVKDALNVLENINTRTMKADVRVWVDGELSVREVGIKFDVCPTCCGAGRHVNPSVDASGISQEEFDADPEFRAAYFRGDYDMTCVRCDGKRVVPVVDPGRTSSDTAALIEADIEAYEEDQHLLAMELRYGA